MGLGLGVGEVGRRAILQRAANEVVQEGKVRVDVEVLAGGVDGQGRLIRVRVRVRVTARARARAGARVSWLEEGRGRLHERQVVAERLQLGAVLRERDVGGVDPLGRHLVRVRVRVRVRCGRGAAVWAWWRWVCGGADLQRLLTLALTLTLTH